MVSSKRISSTDDKVQLSKWRHLCPWSSEKQHLLCTAFAHTRRQRRISIFITINVNILQPIGLSVKTQCNRETKTFCTHRKPKRKWNLFNKTHTHFHQPKLLDATIYTQKQRQTQTTSMRLLFAVEKNKMIRPFLDLTWCHRRHRLRVYGIGTQIFWPTAAVARLRLVGRRVRNTHVTIAHDTIAMDVPSQHLSAQQYFSTIYLSLGWVFRRIRRQFEIVRKFSNCIFLAFSLPLSLRFTHLVLSVFFVVVASFLFSFALHLVDVLLVTRRCSSSFCVAKQNRFYCGWNSINWN